MMKLLYGILMLFLLGMTLPVHASDEEMQVNLLLARISAALKNDRTSEALSYCATLEKMGPSLANPLPESFYFYYIETLHRSGAKEILLSRIYAYLQKYGKDGFHYGQIIALFSELQMEAMAAGKEEADAAVIAWEEVNRLQKEKEHEQVLGELRACQGEAIALEGTEKELSVAFLKINAQSDELLIVKAALDQRVTMIDRSKPGTPEEPKQMRIDFNRDSQSYNEAVRDFNDARKIYNAKVEEQNSCLQRYENRCTDLLVIKYDMEAVCGKSDDWFCRGSK